MRDLPPPKDPGFYTHAFEEMRTYEPSSSTHHKSDSITVARYVKRLNNSHRVSIMGATDAISEGDKLINEYLSHFAGLPDNEMPIVGLTGIRNWQKQIARRGETVAETEAHRDREKLTVYLNHEDSILLISLAEMHGYAKEPSADIGTNPTPEQIRAMQSSIDYHQE